jgi:hypothetical protein|tara:strand:- start:222 stop:416 length:195 start_codon:yes stop_codon:yes gene_type:complete
MTKEQAKKLTDEELYFSLQDYDNTSRLHDHGTIYYDKLLSDYALIIDELGNRGALEYLNRYIEG